MNIFSISVGNPADPQSSKNIYSQFFIMNKTFRLGLTVTFLAVFNPCIASSIEESSQKKHFKKGLISTSLANNQSKLGINLFNLSTPVLMLNPQLTAQTKARVSHSSSNTITGTASWYGPGFEGRVCANGEIFNPNALTAAHPDLPFNTRVRVTNLNNGLSVVVRINDRGPYENNRMIDLSAQAAREIGMYHQGVAQVSLEIL